MKTNRFFLSAAAAMALLLDFQGAYASAFTNGSFEDGLISIGNFTTLNANDSTSITGWTVSGGDPNNNGANAVDYIGSYWTAADGPRSLDLNGLVPGSISQTFDVVAGQTYKVTFSMAGNPAGGPDVKTLDATANVILPFDFNISGHDLNNMGWITKSFYFTATGSSETLTFASTTFADSGVSGFPTAFGPALDNVAVTPVPEASTWTMMVLGFLGLGLLAHRRSGPGRLRLV